MARLQLRDTTIYLQDGLSGTAAVNDVAGIVDTDTDIDIDTISLNPLADGVTDVVPIGARFTVAGGDGTVYTVTGRTPSDGSATTTNIVWTPAADASNTLADDGVITFLPQRIEIKVGDGDISWTEAKQYEYDLDRDQLDTVRQGADVPVSVEMAFTFEYVTTQSGQAITPVDALKRAGQATEWRSSSADACEPYAVDIYIVHNVPCGTDHDQDFLFPDFRYEELDFSLADAAISVSGQCNVTEVTTTRASDIS